MHADETVQIHNHKQWTEMYLLQMPIQAWLTYYSPLKARKTICVRLIMCIQQNLRKLIVNDFYYTLMTKYLRY
jgi:hypothetical protein